MSSRHKGFTLAEMVVVMGIILLFIIMAIPAIRSVTGSTSIGMTRNNVSALLARAREEAVAEQAIRGVMFFVDPNTNRIIGVIVQIADIQDSNIPTCVLLDAVPNRDSMPLPAGVRLQTVFNGVGTVNSGGIVSYANSAAGLEDRYLGSNPLPVTVINSPYQVKIGGVILFDGNGRLISRPYGFQMAMPYNSSIQPSNLCTFLNIQLTAVEAACVGGNAGMTYNPTVQSYEYIPGYPAGANHTVPQPPATVLSQVGMILFDYNAFISQGFTDQDADIINASPTAGYTTPWPVGANNVDGDGVHTEQEEEAWLDTNSTPLMVNRYDGTLIRGE